MVSGSFAIAILTSCLGGEANAVLTFGNVRVLNGNASVDGAGGDDRTPSVATDGSGNWVAVWSSTATLGGTVGTDEDILVINSLDGAHTWSYPIALNADAAIDSEASGDDASPRVATDGAGTWITIWRRHSPDELVYSLSVDSGATWTAPTGMGLCASPSGIKYLGGAEWLVLANTTDDLGGTVGTDSDLVVLRSSDGGASWELPIVVNTDAAIDDSSDGSSALATDRMGNVVVVWSRTVGVRVLAATSVDNGQTWSPPVEIFDADATYANSISLETDGEGRWAVVWQSPDNLDLTVDGDVDIMISTSDDVGASWSPARLVDVASGMQGGSDVRPTIVAGSGDRWYVAWTQAEAVSLAGGRVGNDGDLVISRSLDDGETWTSPAGLNTNAHFDRGDDVGVQLIGDGREKWVAAWVSRENLGGAIDTDRDLFVATATELCPSAPAFGCLGTSAPARSRMFLKNDAGGRDQFKWKWRGIQIGELDLGNPLATSDYAACLYESVSGESRLVMEQHMLAGVECKSKPCWKSTSKGFRYKDGRREHGAVRSLELAFGTDDGAKLKLSAKGPSLGPPIMPLGLSPAVTMQLFNLEGNRCWEARFGLADANDAEEFRARSD